MASTYSPNLRIELIGTGDQAGNWGTTTNTNLGTLIEDSVSGYEAVSVTSANQALTALNGVADQSRNAVLALTNTTGANFSVYAPPASKQYTIYNASSYVATIYNSTALGNTTAAGSGIAIPAGKTMTVWSDGTNFSVQNNHLQTLTLSTDLAVADGGTGASTAADARTNLGVTATGADTTYAFRANNLSDLASASSARTNLGLGSVATQNSNAISITGGSISGITDLAVADGGTGASDAGTARTNLDVPSRGGSGASGTWAINAASATVLQTARLIGGVSFNGSSNIDLPGVNTAGNQNTSGNAASATVLQTARTIGGVSFNGSGNINLPGVDTAGNQNTSGNAASATILQTTRTIGGVGFNGSADINLPGVNIAGNQNTSGNAATASSVAYTNVTGRPPVGWKQVFSGVVVGATTAPIQFFRTWRILYGATGTPAREMVSPDSFMVTTSLNDLYITSGTSESIYNLTKSVGIVYPALESKFYITWNFANYPVPNNINVVIYVADTTGVHSLTAL
jgi:hypothetical protein